jgi:hypothetical protein
MPVPAVASPTLLRVLRGSAVGLGILVSVAVVAPPALASPLSATDGRLARDSAVGWPVEAHLTATPAPKDLDLSGARLEVIGSDDRVLTSCETQMDGACPFPIVNGMVPGTTYRLRQDATRPVPGLIPSTETPPFTACTGSESPDCPGGVSSLTIADFSLFRTGLSVAVHDGSTHAPVAGASYSLTGPDYRHRPPVLQQDQSTTFPQPSGAEVSGTVVSGPAGLLTFSGFFLDGEWALTPERIPPGYRSSGVLPVTLPPRTEEAGESWAVTVDLPPDDVAVSGTGGGGAVVPPAVPTASTPSRATVPTRAAAVRPAEPAYSPSHALPGGHGPAGASSASASAAAPTFSAPLPFVDEGDSQLPSGVDPATGDPQLRAAASTRLLDAGLIGVGVLFVAIVVFAVGYVRRRVRH